MRFNQDEFGRRIGDLGVVRLRPGPHPGIPPGGQVRAEVVADDRNPGRGRVEGAQVAAELQEPGAGLARLDVPGQLVPTQLISSKRVPDPGGAPVRRAHPQPRRPSGFFVLAADRGPLPPGMRLQIEGPELIGAEDHLWIARLGRNLPAGDRVKVLDPGFLRRVARVRGGLPGSRSSMRRPSWLMSPVHPLGHQEVRQLGQAPSGNGRSYSAGLALATDPLPRRMIRTRRCPSSSSISRTRSRSLTGPVSAISTHQESPD